MRRCWRRDLLERGEMLKKLPENSSDFRFTAVRLTAAPRCRTHGATLQRFVVVALVQIFWVTDFTDSSMCGVSDRVTRHPTDLQSLACQPLPDETLGSDFFLFYGSFCF